MTGRAALVGMLALGACLDATMPAPDLASVDLAVAGDLDSDDLTPPADLLPPDLMPWVCAGKAAGLPVADDHACTLRPLVPPPTTFATVLDLRDRDGDALKPGRCHYEIGRRALQLPSDPAAYPIQVRLPALDGPDCACDFMCNGLASDPRTAFGISIQQDVLAQLPDEYELAVRVPPPWFAVSGGCGEACSTPCLGGYQEFGLHHCITYPYGDFGFATADEHAPSVDATIELVLADDSVLSDYACCGYTGQ